MKHTTKALREATQLREEIETILAEADGWRGYEDQRRWLRKLLQREASYTFTESEREAVRRIGYARTFFEGWAGYSVQELVRAAQRYITDFDYESECFLKEIEHATRAVRGDMRALVGLCRTAGMEIPRFGQRANEYEDA
ncbi:hypothetical protein AAFG13_36680 [Bradyrhizobium sp. B124]|uniref:hypothetical protein n=1 Tax=Bradyrhizobium sp. B124 TaxID=3140245 RepID=UPI003183B002